MAQKFENEVSILIKARDVSQSVFDDRAKKTSDFAKKIKSSQKGAADQLAKIFTAVGFVEGGFKSLAIVTEAWNGDLDKSIELAKSLPFGLGAAFTAGQQLGDALFGVNKELEKSNALLEEQARRSKILDTQAKTRQAQLKTANSLTDELRIARAEGFDKDRIAVEIDTQKRIKAIREEGAKDNSEISARIERDSIEIVVELRAIALKEIAIARAEAIDAEGRKVFAEMDRRRDAEIRANEEVARAKNDANRKLLAQSKADAKFLADEAKKAQAKIDSERPGESQTQARGQQARFLTGVSEAATQFNKADPVVKEQKETNVLMGSLIAEMQNFSKAFGKAPFFKLASGTASGA